MTDFQLKQWHADRARQALIGTNYGHAGNAHHRRSRGEYFRQINNGIALRTFRSIMSAGPGGW